VRPLNLQIESGPSEIFRSSCQTNHQRNETFVGRVADRGRLSIAECGTIAKATKDAAEIKRAGKCQPEPRSTVAPTPSGRKFTRFVPISTGALAPRMPG
jgi:hypothetical protein